MTLQEENQELRERLESYEALLEKVMDGPLTSGTITSKSAKDMYRVTSDEGRDSLLLVHPEVDKSLLKEGARVMYNQVVIKDILPTELEKTPEQVNFDFIDWSQIAGLKSQVERIKEAVYAPIMYKDYYKQYGLTPCKGVLLYGPPGCGKTLIAKAIASAFLKGKNITKDSFIYMKGGEMLSPWVGMAENNIKSAFVRARRNYKKNGSKSIIFIDEAEALLPARGSRRSSDVDTTIVPTFLSEMDGLEDSGTFIILATNFPNQLDPAVIRPGRIDMRIEIGRPNKEDAMDIFDLYLNKTKCSKDSTDLALFAASELFDKINASHISGAFIKSVVDKACLLAIKRAVQGTNNGVTEEDIQTIINEQ